MSTYEQRAKATHLLDTLDAVQEQMGYWFATGEYTSCSRCGQRVPAFDAAGAPVRHRLDRVGQPGVWCEGRDGASQDVT